jgi:NitT/TauT family transport system substrate-binding protein
MIGLASARALAMPVPVLLAGLLAALAAPADGGTAGGRVYRIATTPWMGWAFLDVADAKGYWREEGVRVELAPFPDGTSYLDAQIARRADFACAMAGDVAWIGAHRSATRILLETDWSHGGDKVIVRRGKSLAELAGRPVGVYQARYALPFFLRKVLGPDWKYVAASPKPVFKPEDLIAQFKAGRLDLCVLCDPFAGELGPEAAVRATSADVAGSIPEVFFGYRDVVDAMPPGDLAGLVRGIFRGMAWMQDPAHEPELLEIVQARSFRARPLRDLDDLRAQMRSAPVHAPALLRERNAPGGGLASFLHELHAFIRIYDPGAREFAPADLFDAAEAQRLLAGSR